MAGFGAYIATSATVLRGAFDVSAEHYGFYFSIIALFFVISAITSTRIILKVGQHGLIAIGSSIAIFGGVTMLGLSLLNILELLFVVIPAGLYVFGIGWIFSQSNALALQPFSNSAGTASTLIGFINGLLSAGMGFYSV